jgi:hypothetical protein
MTFMGCVDRKRWFWDLFTTRYAIDLNRLGFAYQLAFVRLANRFPAQRPLEIVDDLLTYVSVQLAIAVDAIAVYQQRRQTIAEHRAAILAYLNLRRFGDAEAAWLEQFLFEEACRLEQTGPHNRAQEDIDEELRKRRQVIRSALTTFKTVGNVVLDSSIDDRELR